MAQAGISDRTLGFAETALQEEREALKVPSYETLWTAAGSLADLVLGDVQERQKPTHVTRGAAVFMFFEYKNVFCEGEEIDTTK